MSYKIVNQVIVCPPAAADNHGKIAMHLFESHPWVRKVMREQSGNCAELRLAEGHEIAYCDYLKRKDSGR